MTLSVRLTCRRTALTAIVFAWLTLLARPIFAEEVAVPVARQAELLVRVAAYDRNLPGRARGTARVLILVNPNDTDSRSVAEQMGNALRRFDRIAGLPSEITVAPYAGGAQLADYCRSNHIAIVYVTPGLGGSAGEIAQSLDGVDVMTSAAIARFVADGIVLGFDLVDGKPTLLINLTQAKKQNVAIAAEVLHLMKVVK